MEIRWWRYEDKWGRWMGQMKKKKKKMCFMCNFLLVCSQAWHFFLLLPFVLDRKQQISSNFNSATKIPLLSILRFTQLLVAAWVTRFTGIPYIFFFFSFYLNHQKRNRKIYLCMCAEREKREKNELIFIVL